MRGELKEEAKVINENNAAYKVAPCTVGDVVLMLFHRTLVLLSINLSITLVYIGFWTVMLYYALLLCFY